MGIEGLHSGYLKIPASDGLLTELSYSHAVNWLLVRLSKSKSQLLYQEKSSYISPINTCQINSVRNREPEILSSILTRGNFSH